MQIERRFTKHLTTPYDDQTYVPRISFLQTAPGKPKEHVTITAPDNWSQLAVDILAQKYMRRTGVKYDNGDITGETDARQVFERLVHCWTYWGLRGNYFTQEDATIFRDEMLYMLSHQIAAPNSPQWFNTGLHHTYGIKGPAQGLWRHDLETGETTELTNTYEHPQSSACQPYHARVSTPQGLIPIGDIVTQKLIGLEVFDSTGITKVMAVKVNGTKPVYKITLANGLLIEATGDHLIKAVQERRSTPRWLRVDALCTRMKLHLYPHANNRIQNNVEESTSQDISEAALAGWLQADGFVGKYEGTNKSLTIEFMTVTQEEYDWVMGHLETAFHDKHYRITEVPTQNTQLNCKRIRLYGAWMKPFIEKYRLLPRGPEIRVPNHLFTAPLPQVVAYLKSIFQGDGYIVLNKYGEN